MSSESPKLKAKKKQNLVDSTNLSETSSEVPSEYDPPSSPKKQKLDENPLKNFIEEIGGNKNASTSVSKKENDCAKSPARESARIKKQIENEENSKSNDREKSPSKSGNKKKTAAKKKQESESESESESASSSEDEVKKKTKKRKKRTFDCFHCNAIFQQTTELFMHTCEGKREKGFTCEVCGKTFILRSSFINHKIIHSKSKPYRCTLCGKKSSQQSNHLYHMSKQHPGEKPFPCRFLPCTKSFMTRMEQKKHHILHRKTLCRYCDKSFADKPTMLKHKELEHEQYFSDRKSKKSKKTSEVSTENEKIVDISSVSN